MHNLVLNLVLFSASVLTDCQQKPAQNEQLNARLSWHMRGGDGVCLALHLVFLQYINLTDFVD